MPSFADQATSRRRFLQFLAGSPLACRGRVLGLRGRARGPGPSSRPIMWAPLKTENLIKSPKEAINVFDFEPVMRARRFRPRISATWPPASTMKSRRANREDS